MLSVCSIALCVSVLRSQYSAESNTYACIYLRSLPELVGAKYKKDGTSLYIRQKRTRK